MNKMAPDGPTAAGLPLPPNSTIKMSLALPVVCCLRARVQGDLELLVLEGTHFHTKPAVSGLFSRLYF